MQCSKVDIKAVKDIIIVIVVVSAYALAVVIAVISPVRLVTTNDQWLTESPSLTSLISSPGSLQFRPRQSIVPLRRHLALPVFPSTLQIRLSHFQGHVQSLEQPAPSSVAKAFQLPSASPGTSPPFLFPFMYPTVGEHCNVDDYTAFSFLPIITISGFHHIAALYVHIPQTFNAFILCHSFWVMLMPFFLMFQCIFLTQFAMNFLCYINVLMN